MRRSPIPIAAGEWLATSFEFLDLMDRGTCMSCSPTSDGSAGSPRRCASAGSRASAACTVVPHGWKTGITVAATAQLAAVTPHLPFFEFVPQEVAESPLRRELVQDELSLENGLLALPSKPGLGVVPDAVAMERFVSAAKQKETSWHR